MKENIDLSKPSIFFASILVILAFLQIVNTGNNLREVKKPGSWAPSSIEYSDALEQLTGWLFGTCEAVEIDTSM